MKFASLASVVLLAAAAAADDKPYDLQGRFAPPDGTAVRWSTTTVLEGGTYTAIRGIVPMDGRLDQTEEREMVLKYVSPSRREITISKHRSVQVEKFPDRKNKETHQITSPLEGARLAATLANSHWTVSLASGEPTEEQAAELAKIARRLNHEADLFESVTGKKIGDKWQIPPKHFLDAAGYDDVSEARGTVSATLRSVNQAGAHEQAIVDLDIDVQALLAPPKSPQTKLKLKSQSTVTRSLSTKLDLTAELNGHLTRSGQLPIKPGLLQPYSLTSPIKFRSAREILTP